MATFKFTLTEVLERYIEVEADNVEAAYDKVYQDYNDGLIILDSEDFSHYDIKQYN